MFYFPKVPKKVLGRGKWGGGEGEEGWGGGKVGR